MLLRCEADAELVELGPEPELNRIQAPVGPTLVASCGFKRFRPRTHVSSSPDFDEGEEDDDGHAAHTCSGDMVMLHDVDRDGAGNGDHAPAPEELS